MITMDQLLSLLNSAIAFGTVIMLGALGEILIEKCGNRDDAHFSGSGILLVYGVLYALSLALV